MIIRSPGNICTVLFALLAISQTGCLLLAAGAGAEAAYVTTQGNRTAGETLDDQRITSSIKTKLLADPVVSAFDINVDTFKSEVTLRGLVKSREEADRALEIARGVAGVKTVTSKLFID